MLNVLQKGWIAVQTVGLKIMRTVWDQGTTNIKAIKILKENTNRAHLKNEVENKYFGFTIDKQNPYLTPFFYLKRSIAICWW